MKFLVHFKNDEEPITIDADRVTNDKQGVFLFLAGDRGGEPVAAIPLDNVWYIRTTGAQGDS